MQNKNHWRICDVIYLFLTIVLFVIVIWLDVSECHKNNMPINIDELISHLLLVFLGFVGLVDMFRLFGWNPLVPSFIINRDEQQSKETIRACIETELDALQAQPDHHIQFFLKQVGLSRQSYMKLKYEIISLKLHQITSLNDARQKLYGLVLNAPILIHQSTYISPDDRKYSDVDYFIDFSNVMFEQTISDFLVQSLAKLIQENESDLDQIEWIVMPQGGNYLLCYRVSEALNKHFLPIYSEAPLDKKKRWMGVMLEPKNCIIINDVLVSGSRILDAANALSNVQQSFNAYFLVNRNDKEYSKKQKKSLNHKINARYLIEIDDKTIQERVQKK